MGVVDFSIYFFVTLLSVVCIFTLWNSHKRKKYFKQSLKDKNFDIFYLFNNRLWKYAIAFDMNQSKLALMTINNNYSIKIYNFSQLKDIKFEKDIIHKNFYRAPSSLIKLEIKGILLLKIGNISGENRFEKKINSLAIELYMDDLEFPFWKLYFFISKWPIDLDSKFVREKMLQMEFYLKLLHLVKNNIKIFRGFNNEKLDRFLNKLEIEYILDENRIFTESEIKNIRKIR